MFLLRSVFWLGLALLFIHPPGTDFAGSAARLGTAAVETGRAAALEGIGQVKCDSFECAGAKLIAQSALTPAAALAAPAAPAMPAPYPAPPLVRRAS